MAQWLGTHLQQRNLHERTHYAHDVSSFSNLVQYGVVALRKCTFLVLEDLHRCLVHNVDNATDLLQCLPRKNLRDESPEVKRTDIDEKREEFPRDRYFEYCWPGVLVGLPHRAE